MIDFNPKIHKDKQLYELQTRRIGKIQSTVLVPTSVSFETAAKTPWFYVVEE